MADAAVVTCSDLHRFASLPKAWGEDTSDSKDKPRRRMSKHSSLPTLTHESTGTHLGDTSRLRSAVHLKKLSLPPLERASSSSSQASPASSHRSIASMSTRSSSTTSSSSSFSCGNASWPARSPTQTKLPNVCVARESEQDIDTLSFGSVEVGNKVQDMLDMVFDKLTAKDSTGLMRFRQWKIATNFLEQNPVLRGRAKSCDVDRLFYGQTHKKTVRCGITRRQFIPLLEELSQAMDVPVSLVLLAVGCHAEFLDAGSEEPIKRSSSVTVPRKLKLQPLPRRCTV